MPADRVVEHLDVVEHIGPRGLAVRVDPPLDTLLLQRTEEGADQATDLPEPGHGDIGRVRLHRDVLQPDPPTRFRWRRVTGRV